MENVLILIVIYKYYLSKYIIVLYNNKIIKTLRMSNNKHFCRFVIAIL